MLAWIMPITDGPPIAGQLPPSTPGGKPPSGGDRPGIWPPIEPVYGGGLRPTHPIVIMPPTHKPTPPPDASTKPPDASAKPPSDEPGWVWIYNPATGQGRWVNVPAVVEAIRAAMGGEETAEPK